MLECARSQIFSSTVCNTTTQMSKHIRRRGLWEISNIQALINPFDAPPPRANIFLCVSMLQKRYLVFVKMEKIQDLYFSLFMMCHFYAIFHKQIIIHSTFRCILQACHQYLLARLQGSHKILYIV